MDNIYKKVYLDGRDRGTIEVKYPEQKSVKLSKIIFTGELEGKGLTGIYGRFSIFDLVLIKERIVDAIEHEIAEELEKNPERITELIAAEITVKVALDKK